MNNLKFVLFVSLAINLILTGLLISGNRSARLQNESNIKANAIDVPKVSNEFLFEEINPQAGVEINATYGDLGPKMISSGVIDLEKFRAVFQKSGQPLTDEQEKILAQGSSKKIRITRENSYFLLNYFWAVGLANKTKILTEGEMVRYGGEKDLGNFASTGGWSLGATDAMNYYSKSFLIPLTPNQEGLVQVVASQIYRPCCNNSTAFPDCNHGMALLGVLELLAANGRSQDEMFQAAKYFNAYWFPGTYYDLATYFKNKEGKDFKKVDPRIILSKDYSSATGYQTTKNWLVEQGLVSEPTKQGGGCGV